MARSHHKGHYVIRNGSDKEPGGVRRGPKRKPVKPKPSLLRKLLEDTAKDVLNELAKGIGGKIKKHFAGRLGRRKKSHHKGEYPIRNGSDTEDGGVRRGPPLRRSNNIKLELKRARWRQRAKARRGK